MARSASPFPLPAPDSDPSRTCQTLPPAAETDLTLGAEMAGRRLDQVLAELLPAYSRSRLQQWIERGRVQVDGCAPRPRDRVRGGERVQVQPEAVAVGDCRPEPIPLAVVDEDEHLLIVDKPPGLVVHPAAGHADGTLANALLHHAPALAALPRCGIVHRLDKDTSGLMVVAKSLLAHRVLVAQLARRSVHREYRALVVGTPVAGGRIEAPIGRHPIRRTAMAVVPSGRPATTDYRILKRLPGHAWLAVNLSTGRTHQIRVHLAHLHHPVVGDPVYGGRRRLPPQLAPAVAAALQRFPRQALHALRLGLVHPVDERPRQWETPLPADMAGLLALLEAID